LDKYLSSELENSYMSLAIKIAFVYTVYRVLKFSWIMLKTLGRLLLRK